MTSRPLLGHRRPHGDAVEAPAVVDLRDEPAVPKTRDRPESERYESGRAQLREVRVFGSPAFRRLWFSQLASSLGDWIGIIAITAIANDIGGDVVGRLSGVSLVLAARLIPGFFFAPIAGVLVDRWDRKKVMVICDFGRAATLCMLPFVDSLFGLVMASLALELLTLMWSPAKEASVPNLVRRDFLPTANSLSLAAAYGPLLIAPAITGLLAKVPHWTGQSDSLRSLNLTDLSVPLYFDALTYLISAAVIATLTIPHIQSRADLEDGASSSGSSGGIREAREGFAYLRHNLRVRTVIVGLAVGLVGGAMVVPLGPSFATDVLHAGTGGYSLLLSMLGAGAASGMLALTVLQKRLPLERVFALALVGAGSCLFFAASVSELGVASVFAALMGVCAGAAYVLGFSSVQTNTIDEMRGRVFATLYTLTRFCILLALVVAPLLAAALGGLANNIFGGQVSVFGLGFDLPGVRITFWIGGIILIAAGTFAAFSLRRPVAMPS